MNEDDAKKHRRGGYSGGQKRGPEGYPKYQEQAQNEKGVHTPVSGVTDFPGGKGTSRAGDLTKDRYDGKPTFSGKDHPAKAEHRRVLSEMKGMKKPKIYVDSEDLSNTIYCPGCGAIVKPPFFNLGAMYNWAEGCEWCYETA